MKLKNKAILFLFLLVVISLALDYYQIVSLSTQVDTAVGLTSGIASTLAASSPSTPSSDTQDDTIKAGPDVSSEETIVANTPLLRIDISREGFAVLILAVVLGVPVGIGVFKNLDAISDRIRKRD